MLSPYRVLDLTDSHAQLGPMILADLGAEVIRIEPRGSDRHSGLYHVYNRGKKLTQCDIDTSEGKAQLLELVKSADVLFEDAGPGASEPNPRVRGHLAVRPGWALREPCEHRPHTGGDGRNGGAER